MINIITEFERWYAMLRLASETLIF